MARSHAPDAPDHPDTLAFGRRLIVDTRGELLRPLVDRLGDRARARQPVDSLALVRAMELWSEHAAQPRGRPDSTAAAWALTSVRVKERELGPDHHELAHSLGTLGGLAENARDLPLARQARERAVRILRGKQGPERAGLMTLLDDLGRAAYFQSQPALGESLMREALAEGRAAGITDQPRYQSVLNNLAVVLEQRGALAEALGIQQSLLELRLRQFGPVHRRVQLTRINLGNLLQAVGDYEAALEQARTALALDSLLEGQGASRREVLLQNLSGFTDALGDFAAGRRMLETAMRAAPDSTPYLEVMLGESYRRSGDRARAFDLLRRGLAGLKAIDGIISQQATALAGLASLEEDEGRIDRAIALHLEALQLRQRFHGGGHANTAASLLDLARCELAAGRLVEAMSHADSATAVLRRARPASHPDHAQALLQRARVLAAGHRVAAAEACVDSADALLVQALGPSHPRRAETLGESARMAAARGDTARAIEDAARAAEIQRRSARIALASLTENEAVRYARTQPRQRDLLLDLAARAGGRVPGLAQRALDETIRSRGLILDAAVARRRSSLGPGARDSSRVRLEHARRRLARLWVAGLRDRSPQIHRLQLDHAWAEVEQAEKALVGLLPGSRRDALDPPGLTEVVAALPVGATLVSFARYQPAESAWPEGGPRRVVARTPPDRYVAFIQASGGAPAVVALATAAEIDEAVGHWRRAAEDKAADSPEAEARYRRVATRLRRLIWDPLAPRVAGATRILVVPDGQLQLVDLAVLPGRGGRYLVETEPPISLLTGELDLLAGPAAESDDSFLGIADPAFDAVPRPAAAGKSAARRGVDGCEEFARRTFVPLPASGLEIDGAHVAWKAARPGRSTIILRGAEATESRLRELSPGVTELHLATHGFFLSDRCRITAAPESGGATADADDPVSTALLRAGLALAGANRRFAAADPEDDGILTAEEIALLDLRSARSVVLSACETAQGDALPGEGLFGLRRALRLAGARSVVAGLWSIEDHQARAWMDGYYSARWREARGVGAATQQASRALLEARRGRGLTTHPRTWGGIVAVGMD